ncbi:hypothetical protein EUGRSUZ_F01376 [Eucalyptus grandis]|uniref:Uncharacterized protein n=2 Tax=Eucalyptus grandis TaxID=71139 RepID=A0ACC3KDN1_EUCGR|nr:hypothetical protein EUGRSUZ_F01376 [Eucalyptus grandis]
MGFLFAFKNALFFGQSAAAILGEFYFDKGGKSKWMAALVQTVAFPLVYLLPSLKNLNPVKELLALLLCDYTSSCRYVIFVRDLSHSSLHLLSSLCHTAGIQ